MSFKDYQPTGQTIQLDPQIFNEPLRRDIIHNVFIYFRKLNVWNLVKTDRYGDINKSKRKIRQQKGTGRARAGHRFAPQFKGGVKIHGPRVRELTIGMNKKVVLKALKSMLSAKLVEGKFTVL